MDIIKRTNTFKRLSILYLLHPIIWLHAPVNCKQIFLKNFRLSLFVYRVFFFLEECSLNYSISMKYHYDVLLGSANCGIIES